MALNLFRMLGVAKGHYLDVGAHHPHTISNTALLYERGWRGVNVEANPNLIGAFLEHRHEDQTVNVGVGPTSGEQKFYMFSDTSGRNTFSSAEVAGQIGVREVHRQIMLPVVTINKIVEEHCGDLWPEFLNCDIEGLDYDVLETASFVRSAPMVICAEIRREFTRPFETMMSYKGFSLYARMGDSLFFVRIDLRDLVL